jgi:uncharacterized damage-inducible protein DinB
MNTTAVSDLLDQYRRTIHMLYEEIERFDDAQWVKGIDFFLTPVNIAMHIVDCLDYYFSGKSGEEYHWGHHFGGGWWELPADRLPDKATVATYTREIEARIVAELESLTDEDLSRSFTTDDSAKTLLGHYVYALRHTVHHHGELAALSVYHGNQGGSWE